MKHFYLDREVISDLKKFEFADFRELLVSQKM